MKKFSTGYMDEALDPEGLSAIIQKAQTELAGVDFDTMVGTGFSGGVVIPTLAMSMGKNFVLLRKPGDNSHHGADRFLGTLGQRWVFVDDFVSSGATERRVYDKVAQAISEPSTRWNYDSYRTEVVHHTTEFVGTYVYVSKNWYPGGKRLTDRDPALTAPSNP